LSAVNIDAVGVLDTVNLGVLIPRPPLAIGKTPVTPVVNGNPVALVKMLPGATAPKTGVTKVGLVFITNVVPVPVCDAIEVALPDEVMGPVKLAFVVTVAALPVIEPAIELVTVKSVNHPFVIRVPVLPIIPLASVASNEAAAPGAGELVMACV
jgi:hypothetical protein